MHKKATTIHTIVSYIDKSKKAYTSVVRKWLEVAKAQVVRP